MQGRRTGVLLSTVYLGLLICLPAMTRAASLEEVRSRRDAFIERFRIEGRRDLATVEAIRTELEALLSGSRGEERARILLELGTAVRLLDRFDLAVERYTECAGLAETVGLGDVAFDAWMGVARSHALGTKNHQAGLAAFEQAVSTVKSEPTAEQEYRMASYSSLLASARNDTEAALVHALDAVRLAVSEGDRFYGLLDVASALLSLAESCDYAPLVDERSQDDGENRWGACQRAVEASARWYGMAGETARGLGWSFLADQAAESMGMTRTRGLLIESKSRSDRFLSGFEGFYEGPVLVNENFESGASLLSDSPLGSIIGQVVADASAADARTLYLLGGKADIEGDASAALAYYRRAVETLERERSQMFDLRKRGLVVENRGEFIRDLGLRLLSLGRREEAFRTFESARARGVSDLVAALEGARLGSEQRQVVAKMARLEAERSAEVERLVSRTIAGQSKEAAIAGAKRLADAGDRRSALIRDPFARDTLQALSQASAEPVTLGNLAERARRARAAVLLYWVTPTNVLVWAISPKGTEVKTVFFPESSVSEQVDALVQSTTRPTSPFAREASARLRDYLVEPFAQHLEGTERLLIVPQGKLIQLPFEALVNRKTGRYLVQDARVSYAPNAFFAWRALGSSFSPPKRVNAVYDVGPEAATGEVATLASLEGLDVESTSTAGMTVRSFLARIGQSPALHLLAHGQFESADPLLSTLTIRGTDSLEGRLVVTAADLLAADWRAVRLAVFSSCEAARVEARISGESQGLSWPLLASGVRQIVMSRWRVKARSNAAWMTAFYRSLMDAEGAPDRAAAAAMRELIESDEWSHPHFWAAPQVLVG